MNRRELSVCRRFAAGDKLPNGSHVAVCGGVYSWNDFFGPLLYTVENPDHWTLSVGLSQFRNLYSVQWNLVMAATVLFMAPVIVLFFAAQKAFVEGITLTGVKG